MRTLALASIAATVLACARESGPGLDSRAAGRPSPSAAAAEPSGDRWASSYPPGRWRLAQPEELSRTLVRLSHILIRHEGVQEGVVSFQLADWTPSPPPPARTLEQARALAEGIALRAQSKPHEFAAIARELTEDIATRDLGGALGTRNAAEFFSVPEVLDAVAALRTDEVSRVVETQYGFHILQKQAPPEEQTLSGARILIAHDQAPWLGIFLSRGPLPQRSREEAFGIAQSLYERALRGEKLADLARQYSDHREAVRGGDFGEWSTRESTPFPREMEILAALDVGGIHPPIDTPFGVAVLQRVENRARQAFAMSTVQQRYDPRASAEDPTSREWVLKNVRGLSLELSKRPGQFAELQKKYCCAREEHWIEGRGEAEAEATLMKLGVGAISREPVALAAAFGIIRRVTPRPPEAAPKLSFELPAPQKADQRHLAENGRLRVLLRGFATQSAQKLALEPGVERRFIALLDGVVTGPELEVAERAPAFERVQQEVKTLLGAAHFERYQKLLDAHIEEQLLRGSSPRSRRMSGTPVAPN